MEVNLANWQIKIKQYAFVTDESKKITKHFQMIVKTIPNLKHFIGGNSKA